MPKVDWRESLAPGDPVRVAGRHGLWQFRERVETSKGTQARVIGPVPKQQIERLVPWDDLKPAGRRVAAVDVATHHGLRELSRAAHSRRR